MRRKPGYFCRLMIPLGVSLSSGLAAATAHAGDIFRGGELYAEHCQDCHGTDGRGVPGVPDLTRGRALLRPDPALFEAVNTGKGAMPGYEGVLRNTEMLDVISYLRTLR